MAALLQNMSLLVGVAVLEKDTNGDVLPVWSYPEVTSELETILQARSGLQQETIPLPFTFTRYKTDWIYIMVQVKKDQSTLKNCVAYAICLITSDYNPEKYVELAKLMSGLYLSTGDPIALLKCWVSVFTKGAFECELGKFNGAEFDPRRSYLATSIRDVVRMFGQEIILLWAALVMKKRIIVFSEKLGILLKLIRAFPILVWHRQNWDILRPFMTLSEHEIADIKTAGVYCAGFVDESVREREDLYDVFVDVNNRTISIASHAKEDFRMTTIHKGICEFLLTVSEDPEKNDQELIKGLAVKTKDLLTKLETLKVTDESDGSSYIDYKTLQSKKLPQNMDRFLYAVATAEGMTKI